MGKRKSKIAGKVVPTKKQKDGKKTNNFLAYNAFYRVAKESLKDLGVPEPKRSDIIDLWKQQGGKERFSNVKLQQIKHELPVWVESKIKLPVLPAVLYAEITWFDFTSAFIAPNYEVFNPEDIIIISASKINRDEEFVFSYSDRKNTWKDVYSTITRFLRRDPSPLPYIVLRDNAITRDKKGITTYIFDIIDPQINFQEEVIEPKEKELPIQEQKPIVSDNKDEIALKEAEIAIKEIEKDIQKLQIERIKAESSKIQQKTELIKEYRGLYKDGIITKTQLRDLILSI